MKSRAQIKAEARAGVKRIYWPAVGILFLGALIMGGLGAVPGVGFLLVIFVGLIVSVGLCNISLGIYRQQPISVGGLFTPFNRYGRVLGGMLWMILWLFLWMLIALIPYIVTLIIGMFGVVTDAVLGASSGFYDPYSYGFYYDMMNVVIVPVIIFMILMYVILFIKALQYFATPFILGDSPNVPATKALDLSKKITYGHKGDFFVAALSVLGPYFIAMAAVVILSTLALPYGSGWQWQLLIYLGFGAWWIFYLVPYYYSMCAGYYDAMKYDAIMRGVVRPEDFGEYAQVYGAQQQYVGSQPYQQQYNGQYDSRYQPPYPQYPQYGQQQYGNQQPPFGQPGSEQSGAGQQWRDQKQIPPDSNGKAGIGDNENKNNMGGPKDYI